MIRWSSVCAGLLVACVCAVSVADDAQLSWAELIQQKDATFAKFQELQQTFQQAKTPEEQAKLQQEFQTLAKRLEDVIFPQLEAKLPAQLEATPDEATKNVAMQLMQINLQRNRYPMILKIAEAVLKTDAANALAMNLSGVAKFALHDFEGSTAAFDAAQKANQLIPQLSEPYLEPAKKYVEYWKQEQEIRAKEEAASGEQQLPQVKLTTSKGEIVLELFENEAPNTVANFVNLVESKFYDGLKFHRVIPGFMAQGGCPFTRAGQDVRMAGQGGPGYTVKCECYEPAARRHFAGTISMAHAGKDTGGSQFFITHLPTPHLDRELRPEEAHTVFGRVVKGMDIVYDLGVGDDIQTATVIRKRNHEYKPVTTPEAAKGEF